MSDSTSGVLKPLSWLLLLALIGVLALYNWYTDSLKQQIAGRDEAMEQTELQLLETGNKLESTAAQETRLKQEMDDLTARYEAEAKTLMGKLDDANQANAALQSDLEQLKQSHADAYAALEAEKQAAAMIAEAARTLAGEEQALQLRYLQTLNEVGNAPSSTVVFPFPIEFAHLAGGRAGKEQS